MRRLLQASTKLVMAGMYLESVVAAKLSNMRETWKHGDLDVQNVQYHEAAAKKGARP